MANRILVVDDDAVSRKLVATTLIKSGYDVIPVASGSEALSAVEQEPPDLIILDVMMPEINGYDLCKRFRSMPQTSHLPIIMLTGQDSLEEKIKGFEAGADDYITKPFQPVELVARIGVLMRRSRVIEKEMESVQGKTIGVFSLRGGVGVSSLAANLGIGLAQLWNTSVVLVDMVLTAGQAALFLNVPMRNTWADLANIPEAEITEEIVNDLLLTHDSGLRVLAAPKNPEEADLITADKVTRVLSILRTHYHYVVLDLPHDFRDTTLAGLDLTDEILLVMAPEMASVRATASALDVFDTLSYDPQYIRLVLNWVFERRGLAREDIENVLKRKINLVLPFAPNAFVGAINLGVPVLYDSPETPVAALLEDFAFYLSKEEHRKVRPENPTDAWLRVAQRYQQRKKKK